MTLTLLPASGWAAGWHSAARRSSNLRSDSRRPACRSGSKAPTTRHPCWADIDGDGWKVLRVAQSDGGKIRFHKNLGDGKLAAGEWLKAEDTTAEAPGVW